MAQYKNDGHTRRLADEDLVRGNVVRTVEHEVIPDQYGRTDCMFGDHRQATPAFSDCVIIDVFFRKEEKYVKLARPHCYVANVDTACPSVLTGVEHFEVSAERLCQSYHLVIQSTGLAASHTV